MEGTPIDFRELEQTLKENDLAGMVDPIQLIVAERRVTTYEQLLAVLRERNEFGHFQIEAADASRARSIMGNAGSDALPRHHHLVIAREAVEETIRVIESLTDETRSRMQRVLSPDAPYSRKMAA
jgi:hypothetical protein